MFAEARTAAGSEAELREQFSIFDLNGDGHISLDELASLPSPAHHISAPLNIACDQLELRATCLRPVRLRR